MTKSPQQLQELYAGIVAPRSYQGSVGVDRTINKYARISAQYMTNRGAHLTRTLNINTPVNGVIPYGNSRLAARLTESNGFSRTNQFIMSPNMNYKKIFLFGFYVLLARQGRQRRRAGRRLQSESGVGPVHVMPMCGNRAVIGTNIPLPWQIQHQPVPDHEQRDALQHHDRHRFEWRRRGGGAAIAG